MIPVPVHLKDKAQIIKSAKGWTSFAMACDCGSRRFVPYTNFFTSEEELLMKPYYDALHNAFSGCWATTCTVDEDGTRHTWKLLTPAGLDGPKQEVFIPKRPFFATITVLKVKCEGCGAEHLIFDSRHHGYDAITGEHTQEELLYQPHFRSKCRNAVGIEIKVENDPSVEMFQENTGLLFTQEQYSGAFSWIKIYAVNPDGKKRIILDYESA